MASILVELAGRPHVAPVPCAGLPGRYGTRARISLLSLLLLNFLRVYKGGALGGARSICLRTVHNCSTTLVLPTGNNTKVLHPIIMAEAADDDVARVVIDRRIQHPVGVVSTNEDGTKMAQLPQQYARKYGDRGLVKLYKPTPPFFLRYERSQSRTIPPVFESGCMMIFEGNNYMPTASQPHAEPNDEPDTVCMRCFCLLRSPSSGQSNLVTHLRNCRKWSPEELRQLGLIRRPEEARRIDGGRDRRTRPGDPVHPLKQARIDICTSRWVIDGGIAPAKLDKPSADDLFLEVSDGQIGAPCSRTVSANSLLGEVEEDMMIQNLRDDDLQMRLFYSGQPYMHYVGDLWTTRGKLPFLGMDYHYAKPRNTLIDKSELRCARTAGLVHMPGPHTGENIAIATADHFDFILNVPLKRITIAADGYSGVTDISDTFLSFKSDSGGGVHAAARRLGLEHESCDLHNMDLVQLWGYGLAQKHPTAEQLLVRAFIQKARKLANTFSNSTHANEEWAKAAEKLMELVKGMNPKIMDAIPATEGNNDDITNALYDALINDDVEDFEAVVEAGGQAESEGLAVEEGLRIPYDGLVAKRLINDGKTRCWSVTSMLMTEFQQRIITHEYCVAEECEELNFTIQEYRTMSKMLGVAMPIMDVQKYLEGETYNTKSVSRVLLMELLELLLEGPIACPTISNPFEHEDVPLESYEDDVVAKTMLSTTVAKLKQFVFAKMSLVEAITIVLDPRLKRKFFEDLQNLQNSVDDPQYRTDWKAVGEKAVDALKERLTKAITHDEALHTAGQRFQGNHPFQQTRAAAAPAPAPAPAPPPVAPNAAPRRMGSGFAARLAQRRSSGGNTAPAPIVRPTSAATRAANDVDAYLNEPLLDAANHPFMATLDKAAYDPLTAWTRGTLDLPSFQKKPRMDGAYRHMPYIAASAMAYHGGVAAAARNERTFRDTSFINGALQQKMLPKTIARTGLLRRNPESRAPIEKAAERLVDERKRPRS